MPICPLPPAVNQLVQEAGIPIRRGFCNCLDWVEEFPSTSVDKGQLAHFITDMELCAASGCISEESQVWLSSCWTLVFLSLSLNWFHTQERGKRGITSTKL